MTPEEINKQGSDNSENKTEKTAIVTKAGEQSNPLGNELDIMVSIPESLEIKMVNASILTDYEIWFFISSILASVMVGFWVAKIQNTVKEIENILLWNSIVFTVLFIIALIVAFARRKKLNEKSKTIKLKASKASEQKMTKNYAQEQIG
jgi:hypothetical protein